MLGPKNKDECIIMLAFVSRYLMFSSAFNPSLLVYGLLTYLGVTLIIAFDCRENEKEGVARDSGLPNGHTTCTRRNE